LLAQITQNTKYPKVTLFVASSEVMLTTSANWERQTSSVLTAGIGKRLCITYTTYWLQQSPPASDGALGKPGPLS